MKSKQFILSIDQGTSSTKSLIFDAAGKAVAKGTAPLQTNYLHDGWVEQDPEGIYQNVLEAVTSCLQQFQQNGFSRSNIGAIGISNQRETFVLWNREGKPLYPAVVWQCKRSIAVCAQLQQQGLQDMVREKTGLVIDPYFSATKLIWLFQNNAAVREAIKSGEALFGTVDTWLLYRLTSGKVYATDYTNASRTLLFNLHTKQWDDALIAALGLTGIQLPVIKASGAVYGDTTLNGLFESAVPVAGVIGDSHAAAFGEGCFEPGMAKATMGTGCSILMNIGSRPLPSANGMVTTVCWSLEDRIDYALEGVIVSCGATIEWLKNELGLIGDSRETEAMARLVSDNGGVYLIPAFSGLGSPHWQMDRRASLSGMSFGTSKQHIIRAALESISYQVKDVVAAMEKDAALPLKELLTNGAISGNRFVMQFTADLLNKHVVNSGMPDVSALGAAYLAGLTTGIYESIDAIKKLNSRNTIYQPGSERDAVDKGYQGWQRALQAGY